MAVLSETVKAYTAGTHNLLPDEIIPKDAASASLNWLTRDGHIELIYGRTTIGGSGAAGKNYGEHTGYKTDGTAVRFRKVQGSIQYLNGSTWTDVITGLTVDADYVFSNYQSLAGAFVYIFGRDGIYKIVTANPTDHISLYDETKNFKGFAFIDKARTILWGREEDPTGLYGSYIDAQDSTNYFTLLAEDVGTGDSSTEAFGGTLAFKPNRPTRTAFGVEVYAPIAAGVNITDISQQPGALVTTAGHSFVAGDKVYFTGVGGMTELNDTIQEVLSVVSATEFRIVADTTSYTTFTAGGTVAEAEQFIDDFVGGLESNLGGTGTINYATGVFSVTFNTAPHTGEDVFASYQYEDSNIKGVTDFTKSATRLAGQGFVVRQDLNGTAIKIVITLDGSYFSIKQDSCYRFELDSTDLAPFNEIFRTDIGVQSLRSATGTGQGIIFMNTSNPSKPRVQLLQRNPLGDNFDVKQLFAHFRFEDFEYDDCLMDTWDEFIIISCKFDSDENNRLLLCKIKDDTVDTTYYGIRTTTKLNGMLYGGDPVSQTTYELFSGFDDNGIAIENFWESNGETYGNDVLKKTKRLRYKGRIDPGQSIRVDVAYDDGDFQQVGTILGTGGYVDYGTSYAIGTAAIGFDTIGGGDMTNIYRFYMEMKLHASKFRKRKIRFTALGMGYCSIEQVVDFDIWTYQDRIPVRYREKQNVDINGSPNDEANPDY
jgi:hypothetical protein